jgi:hypothetical protein
MVDEVPAIAFLDNPHAPEFFASSATGFFRLENNIVITFESIKVNHATTPGPVSRVVIGRLVLPIGGAQGLVAGLNDFLEKQGVGPSDAIAGGATRQ